MAIISMPTSTLIPYSQDFGLQSNTRSFRSKFTKVVQTQETPGALWICRYSFPVLSNDQMRIYKAFLAKLRGQAGRFNGQDFAFTGTSHPGVTTSAVSGSVTATFSSSITVSIGDYISFPSTGEMKMIVEDSTGVTATVEPPFRNDYTTEATEFVNPSCNMILDTDSVRWTTVSPLLSSLEFSGIEAIS